MDSSTSTENPEQARVVEIDTVRGQIAAIDELIGLARHRIRVFDRDLSQTGWSSAARIDRLASFLREVRGRRLDIIVHDTRYLETACPRMIGLLRIYGHSMTIYRTGAEAKIATDPLLLVDGRHYLHRFHFEQPRAALGINQPEQTQLLSTRFDEIWATGEPGVSGTVLGL
jgi:hypothetical protein